MTDDDRTKLAYHYMGKRDGYAEILAWAKSKKIRLKDIALAYEKAFKERHFSHDWHVGKD